LVRICFATRVKEGERGRGQELVCSVDKTNTIERKKQEGKKECESLTTCKES
jgi:hypothetical protein